MSGNKSSARRWLILVAVSRYAAGDKTMPPLPGVIADVNRLYDVFVRFGEMPRVRTDCLYNQQATRQAILGTLETVAREALESDQVVLHFGGHGCEKSNGDSPMNDGMTRYLLPYDATFDDATTSGISTRSLGDALCRIRAAEVVVIIDSCHGGGLTNVFWQDLRSLQQGGGSRCVMAAARPYQQGIEFEIGSPFTQHLCDALQGRDHVRTSSAGWVSACAAFEYAQERTREDTEQHGHLQTPEMSVHGSTIYLTNPPARTLPATATKNMVLDLLYGQMIPWFEALGYTFEPYQIRGNEYFERIINVPARRSFDRVLVRGICGQARLADVQLLRESVQKHNAHEGWLVTHRLVDPAARDAVMMPENKDLFCYTFDELIEEQVNFSPYFEWLENEITKRDIERLYIPLACSKPEFHPVSGEKMAEARYDVQQGWTEGYIDVWSDYPGKEHVSILGEFGTGKTWFTLRYAWLAMRRYREAQQRGLARPRLPLFIPLRDYAKAVSVESLFSEFFFRKYEIQLPGYRAFEQLNRMGRLLLIFDGFDEMAARVDRQKMMNNFLELAKVVVPNSKAILTCRMEHFSDVQQAIDLLNHGPIQFDILELEHLDDRQVEKALRLRTTSEVVKSVMADAHLLDLARRPVMLEYVVLALPEIEAGKPVDLSRVYLYALQRKMARDVADGRTFTSEADKWYFFCELSWEMLVSGNMRMNFRDFPDRVRQIFAVEVQQQKDLDHWAHDLRNNGMFILSEDGDYLPAHRSLLEFFAAYKFVASLGIMAPDFLLPAQNNRRSGDADVGSGGGDAAGPFTWREYFQPCLAAGQRRKYMTTFAPDLSENITQVGLLEGNSNVLVFAAGMVCSQPESLNKLVEMALYETGNIARAAQSFVPYLKHRDHALPLARGIIARSDGQPLRDGVTWGLGELGVRIPEVLNALRETIADYARGGEASCSAWWEAAFALEKLGDLAPSQDLRSASGSAAADTSDGCWPERVLPAREGRQGDLPIGLLIENLPGKRRIEELKQRLRGYLKDKSSHDSYIDECDAVLIVKHESEAEVQDLFQRSLELIDFATDTKRRRCYRMVWLCGHLGSSRSASFQNECLDRVLTATINPMNSVRNCAIESLGKIKRVSDAVIEAVERSLTDPFYRTRYHAAWALGELRATSSLSKLAAALKMEQVLDVRREMLRVQEYLRQL